MTDQKNAIDELVREYYASQVRSEWHRLVMDAYHRLEFDTTLHYLDKYLPKTGLILDAGGGPGRYTLELAKKGYEIVLLDLSQANLDFAGRQLRRAGVLNQVKEIAAGSIVDLSMYGEGSFDGVICTGGPLSHVLDRGQREIAISELIRVAKPGAFVFVSVMTKLGALVSILKDALAEIGLSHFEQLCDTGDYMGGFGFTACHFYLPEELQQEFSRKDMQILEMAGLEGISAHHSRELNRLAKDESRFQSWLEMHYQTCTHPAVVGMSEHMLVVGRKMNSPRAA
jgi:2-polyprenyl-3-methyl-5-hydroxy-6-metoxy-1,4-benzoquinol methylase